MKVVQINTFSYKATGNIMINIHRQLNEAGYDSYMIWGRGRNAENKHEYVMDDELGIKLHGVYTRLTDKTGFASKTATKKLLKRLNERKPDSIHLHNLHGYYINLPLLFNYIKDNQIKVVWTLHDCWAFTGHCAFFEMSGCEKWKVGCKHCEQLKTYPSSMLLDNSEWNWNQKKNLFSGLNATLVTPSNWLKELVEQSYLASYKTHVIYNGIDRDVYKPTIDDKVNAKYLLDERPIVLGVASEWTERKGLRDIITLASEMPECQFVVVGVTEKQKKMLPKTVRGIVRTENVHELVTIYSAASIFFNPTYEDNFPTTNIEALACGTPILTYDTGGSPEAVISPSVGRVIKKETPYRVNLATVKSTIEDMINLLEPAEGIGVRYNVTVSGASRVSDGNRNSGYVCRKLSEQFDKDQQLREYIPLYESIMS